jgi:hypothetical protein
MKNPMTPAGIEPVTFRFVAKHLNHCATAVPLSLLVHGKYINHAENVFRRNAYRRIILLYAAASQGRFFLLRNSTPLKLASMN